MATLAYTAQRPGSEVCQGPIEWVADDTFPEAKGRRFFGGAVVRLETGELAVQFVGPEIGGNRIILRVAGRPDLAALAEGVLETGRKLDAENAKIAAELASLPDDQFWPLGLFAGETFRRRNGEIWIVVGYTERKVWDDVSDEWVIRRLAGVRPATADESADESARHHSEFAV